MSKADNKKDDEKKQDDAVVTTTAQTSGANQGPFSPLELTAYVLAGLTTVGVTLSSIANKFFKNLFDHKIYENLWKDKDIKYQELYQYALSLPELIKGKKEIENDFLTKVDLRLASTGIPAVTGPISWVKRTWAQFLTLETNEQVDVGTRLGLIAAIAVLAAFFLRPTGGKKKNATTVKKETVTIREHDEDSDQKDNTQAAGQKIYATESLRNTSSTQAGFAAAVDNARATDTGEQRQVQ